MQQKCTKFDLFFQYFVSCSKYLHWVSEFHKSQLIILILHNEILCNNVNFISLGKIFDIHDTFGGGG